MKKKISSSKTKKTSFLASSKFRLVSVMALFAVLGLSALLLTKAATGGCTEARVVQYGTTATEMAAIDKKTTAPNAPVAILVHGGGWRSGYRSYMCYPKVALLNQGFVTMNIDYPLATTTVSGWPKELNSVKAAVAWAKANISQYGGDPNHIVLLGSSAGANLSYLASTQLNATTPGAIRAVAGMSAPTDLTALTTDNAQVGLRNAAAQYLGCAGLSYINCSVAIEKASSPVFNVGAVCATIRTPYYVANGLTETMVPVAQAIRFEAALTTSGCMVTKDHYTDADANTCITLKSSNHACWDAVKDTIPAWLWANK